VFHLPMSHRYISISPKWNLTNNDVIVYFAGDNEICKTSEILISYRYQQRWYRPSSKKLSYHRDTAWCL